MPRKRDDWDRALERLKNEYAFIELWSMGDDVLYYAGLFNRSNVITDRKW